MLRESRVGRDDLLHNLVRNLLRSLCRFSSAVLFVIFFVVSVGSAFDRDSVMELVLSGSSAIGPLRGRCDGEESR